MKNLYESILDTDFDVSIPGENLPGVDKFISILSRFEFWKNWGDWSMYKASNNYLLRDIKNILDALAKDQKKIKPTKKWAVVSYSSQIFKQPSSNYSNPDKIMLYCINKSGGFKSYNFQAGGYLGRYTALSTITINELDYDQVINRKYVVPSEICDLIDYVINSK